MQVTNKVYVLLIAVLLLSGCAQPKKSLYYWGNYQGQLYSHFKGESSPEEEIAVLEADADKAAAEDMALPPGFAAHLGLLYAEAGHPDKMAASLETEKQRFPESSTFMDFLLKKFKP